jgi:hypothetical protein
MSVKIEWMVDTPKATQAVETAQAGRGQIAIHCVLAGTSTACGVPIGESWVRRTRFFRDVNCAHCLAASIKLRRIAREEKTDDRQA